MITNRERGEREGEKRDNIKRCQMQSNETVECCLGAECVGVCLTSISVHVEYVKVCHDLFLVARSGHRCLLDHEPIECWEVNLSTSIRIVSIDECTDR